MVRFSNVARVLAASGDRDALLMREEGLGYEEIADARVAEGNPVAWIHATALRTEPAESGGMANEIVPLTAVRYSGDEKKTFKYHGPERYDPVAWRIFLQPPPVLFHARQYVIRVEHELSRIALDLVGRFDWLDASVGVHPHDAAKIDDDGWAQIVAWARDERVVAIGETGLDYDLDHVVQIARVIARQYSDEVGPWRAYLSTLR